ncbi:hypothetical protein [Hymenobacter guriensis]|uniref:50S ribosomal protein L22 n=1 Tax=Hymenobacter guriensis TaxID=2793065 RepID=A0ABS0L5J8_9BACT|nr:hypothetical protein [Hymenobacter guriensis]MBG8555195.1 hypothetical protein [Hymenobacter guriensis]
MQSHTRSATLKERKEQLILSIEDVKNVQAAKRILSELGSEEVVGVQIPNRKGPSRVRA